MDKIVALCKRRGLIFPASEIYGGIANTYDYGHYGVLLKNNVIGAWWKAMIQERDDIVALDSAIIQHPRTWEASGHLAGFSDPLVECRTCNLRFRADHLEEVRDGIAQHEGIRCGRAPSKLPGDHPDCDLTEAREFNLMFETSIGPVKDAGSTVYLRPETAQGIFLAFKTTLQYARKKPPFGIAQVGKSFRNEITPGNFVFRTLEFEQMEMEFFVPPAEAERSGTSTGWSSGWSGTWRLDSTATRCGCASTMRTSCRTTRAPQATSSTCIPIGWSELEGIANRGDFDLTQHAEHSGQKLEYVDTATGERYVPHVIEPAGGVGRTVLALLCDAYDEDDIGGEQRTVLRLTPHDGAGQGRGAAAREQGRPAREGARHLRGAARALPRRVRHRRLDRQALPPPGRDRHAVGRDRRPPDDGGRHRHPARPRHARAGADRRRRARRRDRAPARGLSGPRTRRAAARGPPASAATSSSGP